MTYYMKVSFILVFSVALCHGTTSGNQLVKHGSGTTTGLGTTNSEPPRASSTGIVGPYSTNSYSGSSGYADSSGGEQHASCTCESSAGNNDTPTKGAQGVSSWWGHWGSDAGSKSGNYDGGYGDWRGYGSFGGSNGGNGAKGSGIGYNP